MKNLEIRLSDNLSSKPSDWNDVGFGNVFTDHVFNMKYDKKRGWHDAEICPIADAINLHPAVRVLHYGQGVFEGLKLYHFKDNQMAFFRLDCHLKRMQNSARRLTLPNFDRQFVKEAIVKLVEIEKSWVPDVPGSALYVRPNFYGSSESLGVSPSDEYNFTVMLSPVKNYYENSSDTVKILTEEVQSRAFPGGTGNVKAIGNYASSLQASNKAAELGYDQVLWLDARDHKYIEEVGTMNIFFVIDGKLVTPELTDSIMPGMTRDSLLKLAKEMGIPVEERKIEIAEIFKASEDGRLTECFGSGTAVTVCPVGQIGWRDSDISIETGGENSISKRLQTELSALHHGVKADRYGWLTVVGS